MSNFQRTNAKSNSHVGNEFERLVESHFSDLNLTNNFVLDIGVNKTKKEHKWDLGCTKNKIIIECKSHKWTKSNKVPSAKLTTWDQAMYYMHLAPPEYRKFFACLKDARTSNKETLAEYYIRLKEHLIPSGVEIWEFCEETHTAQRLK